MRIAQFDTMVKDGYCTKKEVDVYMPLCVESQKCSLTPTSCLNTTVVLKCRFIKENVHYKTWHLSLVLAMGSSFHYIFSFHVASAVCLYLKL